MDYKMEYKTVLQSYDFNSLASEARGKTGSQAAYETADWNATLTKYAKDDWAVKGSGAAVSGSNLVFWVLLERPEKKEGF